MQDGRAFLSYLSDWSSHLTPLPLRPLAADPQGLALVSVDMINGFCHEGPLAGPRVHALIPHVTGLMKRAWDAGVRNILLTQDTHDPKALEFGAFPPHCVRGTKESETIPEIKALPFYDRMTVFEKNSIDSSKNTGLGVWIEAHPEVDRFIIVGDCTDLCIYQMAMGLHLDANARQIHRRVIVPADCVDTYDLPVETARSIGAVPHDADLLHRFFLYSMMLNGVEVVASLN